VDDVDPVTKGVMREQSLAPGCQPCGRHDPWPHGALAADGSVVWSPARGVDPGSREM